MGLIIIFEVYHAVAECFVVLIGQLLASRIGRVGRAHKFHKVVWSEIGFDDKGNSFMKKPP